jgi:ABC-type transport system involved in multi-copper enzyme maturation permease subunit
LYVVLGVSRKTVVLGRYLFVILLNIGCILFSFVVATFGVLGARVLNVFEYSEGNSFGAVLVLSCIMFLVQLIQIPIYFKLGYMKAKFLTVLPFALIGGAFGLVASIAKTGSSFAMLDNLLGSVLGNEALFVGVIILLLVLAGVGSYIWANYAYKRREF